MTALTDFVIVAGATGDLGGRIAHALRRRGATVHALVRPGTDPARLVPLVDDGITTVPVDFADAAALTAACHGARCIVSALSGLEAVIVTAQGQLLDAAVAVGVARFIPSDFSIDYQALPPGANRNFDLRRRFRARLDAASIQATSIFNGAFMDMLSGQMPLIQRGIRRVLYWRSADQRFAVTTKDDTAAFTAAAALDADAPRDLHIAGDEVSVRTLAATMTTVSGTRYRPLFAGTLGMLGVMIRLARTLAPRPGAVFPAWQGMQYLHDMFGGHAPSAPTDNARYPDMTWTGVHDFLARKEQ